MSPPPAIMLVAPSGEGLQLMTASSEVMRLVELFELQTAEGPWPRQLQQPPARRQPGPHRRHPIAGRWFAPLAVAPGLPLPPTWIPMRLRGQTIGVLNLFRTETGSFNEEDRPQSPKRLPNIATIAILHTANTTATQDPLNTQLEERPLEPHRDRAGQGHDRRTARHRCRRGVRPPAGLRSAAEPADVARQTIEGHLDPTVIARSGSVQPADPRPDTHVVVRAGRQALVRVLLGSHAFG